MRGSHTRLRRVRGESCCGIMLQLLTHLHLGTVASVLPLLWLPIVVHKLLESQTTVLFYHFAGHSPSSTINFEPQQARSSRINMSVLPLTSKIGLTALLPPEVTLIITSLPHGHQPIPVLLSQVEANHFSTILSTKQEPWYKST